MRIVVVSKKSKRTQDLLDYLSEYNVEWVSHRGVLESSLDRIQPDWVFVYHWSYIIPESIYSKYRCVAFHTGNLPDDRGGSPIQNQIIKGKTFSKVNAIVVQDPVDSGAVYGSKSISLQGSLYDIWNAITEAAKKLIDDILNYDIEPVPQSGPSSTFKRKKDNTLQPTSIESIYDQIRMLDGEDYPSTHLIVGDYKFDFSRAKMQEGVILADVKIYKV